MNIENKKGVAMTPFLFLSDHGRIRTLNPQSRNLIFYPVELRSQYDTKVIILLPFTVRLNALITFYKIHNS